LLVVLHGWLAGTSNIVLPFPRLKTNCFPAGSRQGGVSLPSLSFFLSSFLFLRGCKEDMLGYVIVSFYDIAIPGQGGVFSHIT